MAVFVGLVVVSVSILPFATAKKPSDEPTNVIFLIGDGMGNGHVTATRIFAEGADGALFMEGIGHTGLSTTHALDTLVTDSAAAGTALATGYKTNEGMVSVTPDGTVLGTVLERAEAQGKSTGLITTSFMCDATPAAFAAHAEDRYDDTAIIYQMLCSGVDIMFGGGVEDFEESFDLAEDQGFDIIVTKSEFLALQPSPQPTDEIDKVLGLFGVQHLIYSIDREVKDRASNEPTLEEMTSKAIELLSQDTDGFFLMVEAGVLDWAGHARDVAAIIGDTMALDDAVETAMSFARSNGNTQVIVTADHETGGLAINEWAGYPAPTSEEHFKMIIGGVTASSNFIWSEIEDGVMTIDEAMATYANITDLTGEERPMITSMLGVADVISGRAHVGWAYPCDGTETMAQHTGVMVPVYSYGPGTEGLGGLVDNTDIALAMFDVIG